MTALGSAGIGNEFCRINHTIPFGVLKCTMFLIMQRNTPGMDEAGLVASLLNGGNFRLNAGAGECIAEG